MANPDFSTYSKHEWGTQMEVPYQLANLLRALPLTGDWHDSDLWLRPFNHPANLPEGGES